MFNWFKSIFKRQKSSKRKLDDIQFNELKKEKQDKIDRILDKISKKGISSLTKSEKEALDSFNKL
jgi:hypothetical protein